MNYYSCNTCLRLYISQEPNLVLSSSISEFTGGVISNFALILKWIDGISFYLMSSRIHLLMLMHIHSTILKCLCMRQGSELAFRITTINRRLFLWWHIMSKLNLASSVNKVCTILHIYSSDRTTLLPLRAKWISKKESLPRGLRKKGCFWVNFEKVRIL